jgi:hypothetical protein
VDIASLAELKARGIPRPACACLSCGRPLIARLGVLKRHHFGHRPGLESARCWATRPEGEAHLAAKRLIQLQLLEACARSRTVVANVSCPTCGATDSSRHEVVSLSPGHRVLVEHWGDPRKVIKPDVQVVTANGDPALFVEVRVTHASTDAKIRFVRESGTPLLEVDGFSVLLSLSSEAVFSCVAHQNLPETTVPCPSCEAQQRAEKEARALHEATVQRFEAKRAREDKVRAQVNAIRPEAERRAIRRLAHEPRDALIAWCHLHCFHDAQLRHQTRLDVLATWHGSDVSLSLVDGSTREVIRTWTGTRHELLRIYDGELRDTARRFAETISAQLGPGTQLETFGGFRTSHFKTAPSPYVRIRTGDGRVVTAYFWRNLAYTMGHESLKKLVREQNWPTIKTEGGKTVIDARAVDRFFMKTRSLPSLACPAPRTHPKWEAVLLQELRQLVPEELRTAGVLEAVVQLTRPVSFAF